MSENNAFLSKEGLQFISENYLIPEQDAIFSIEEFTYIPQYQDYWFGTGFITSPNWMSLIGKGTQLRKIRISSNFYVSNSEFGYLIIAGAETDICGRQEYVEQARIYFNIDGQTPAGDYWIYRKTNTSTNWYLLDSHKTEYNPHKIDKYAIGLGRVENKSISEIQASFEDSYVLQLSENNPNVKTVYNISYDDYNEVCYGQIDDPFPIISFPSIGDSFYINIPEDLLSNIIDLTIWDDDCYSVMLSIKVVSDKKFTKGIYKCLITSEEYSSYEASAEPSVEFLTKDDYNLDYYYRKPSEGLDYTLSDDGTYYIVSGLGTCTDEVVVLASIYNKLPVKKIGSAKGPPVGGVFSYNYTIKKVVVPEGIEEIGSHAFYHCESLEEIVLPSTVTKIGDYCFFHCYSLKYIDLPRNLTQLNPGLFNGCTSLRKVIIKDQVKRIYSKVFSGCEPNLLKIYFEANSITGITLNSDWNPNGCEYFTGYRVSESYEEMGRILHEIAKTQTDIAETNSKLPFMEANYLMQGEKLVLTKAQLLEKGIGVYTIFTGGTCHVYANKGASDQYSSTNVQNHTITIAVDRREGRLQMFDVKVSGFSGSWSHETITSNLSIECPSSSSNPVWIYFSRAQTPAETLLGGFIEDIDNT